MEGGYRRIVASPNPVAIVEIDAIKALLDADQIVIACGGGGIPVMEQGWNLRGASAIIEKDLASGLLAKEVDADVLMILTSVDECYLKFRHPPGEAYPAHDCGRRQKTTWLRDSLSSASMLPKVSRLPWILSNHGKGRKRGDHLSGEGKGQLWQRTGRN